MTAKSKLSGLFAVLWAGFIFWNSSKSGGNSEAMSGGFVNFIISLLEKIGVTADNQVITILVRKSAHILEFCLLAILITLVFTFSGKQIKFYTFNIFFFGLAAAVADEFIQSFIAGRSSEVRDVVIDFIGVILGVIIVAIATRKRPRKRSRF